MALLAHIPRGGGGGLEEGQRGEWEMMLNKTGGYDCGNVINGIL